MKTLSKLLTLTIVYLIINSTLYARHRKGGMQLMHALGGTYMMGVLEGNNGSAAGLCYIPRLILTSSRSSSLSLSANISTAYLISDSDTIHGANGSSLIIETPILLDLNFGHASSKSNRNNFGSHIGIGYASNSMQLEKYDPKIGEYKYQGSTSGMYFNVGIRFKGSRTTSFGADGYAVVGKDDRRVLGIRLYTTFGIGR